MSPLHDSWADAQLEEDAGRTLADMTTLRVGGGAKRVVSVTSSQEFIDEVRAADDEGEPMLVVGGGSNLVVGDGEFPGTVIRVATRGIVPEVSECSGAMVRVAAGENWDDFVAHALEEQWSGLEALSGIPGLVGATPIQNVGAYGAEVGEYIAQVRAYHRPSREVRTLAAADCGFVYRNSVFKREAGDWIVLAVTFQLPLGELSAPIRYAELARRLGVEVGERASAHAVRDAVLELRASKGMVLDEDDHDTWSAGSFFTNPVLTADEAAKLPESAPRFPQGDLVKTSAAWLIDHAGFGKGYGDGPVTLSTKHTLALTNRGGAAARDVMALAREIRSGVRSAFGVTLVPEPVFVGCSLEDA